MLTFFITFLGAAALETELFPVCSALPQILLFVIQIPLFADFLLMAVAAAVAVAVVVVAVAAVTTALTVVLAAASVGLAAAVAVVAAVVVVADLHQVIHQANHLLVV